MSWPSLPRPVCSRSPAAGNSPSCQRARRRLSLDALGLRESLYRIFAARARGSACPAGDVEILNSVLKEALADLRIEAQPAAPEAAFTWSFEPTNLPTAPLWPIARSGADLLASPDFARVTQCDGSGCTWLFLDHSRTRNRRWCSMQSCGNRAKARRHYHRSKV